MRKKSQKSVDNDAAKLYDITMEHSEYIKGMRTSAHRLNVEELREGRKNRSGYHKDRKRDADKRACRDRRDWD